MKQLQPTSVDEYIAEHKVGDTVTGRVVDVRKQDVRVELGEGLMAPCVLPKEPKKAPESAAAGSADVSSLSAMLSAKWKQGKSLSADASREPVRAGQVRSFRISSMDAAQKRIELELV
jgi:small subunit ribosomal protein S1